MRVTWYGLNVMLIIASLWFTAANAETISEWIEKLVAPDTGDSCCGKADGVVPEDWEIKNGKYHIRIHGKWHDVPPEIILHQPNRLRHPVIWINSTGKFICFLPGTMS